MSATSVWGVAMLAAVLVALSASPVATAAANDSYTRLQYVGFPVQTGYNGYLGPNMLYYGENNGLGSYVGLEDIEGDINARIEIMRAAINASASNSSVDHRDDTLKIFLAPEFFFRGPKGAYDANAPELLHIGEKLRRLVEHPRFTDWIFVFGSIIGFNHNENLTAAVGTSGNATVGDLLDTYNFAIIQRGGPLGENHTHFKRFISGIDFLSVAMNEPGAVVYPIMNLNSPDFNETLHPKGIVPKTVRQVEMLYPAMPKGALDRFEHNLGTTVSGGFTMAGVRFCLDICLDHARGVCAAALDKEKEEGGIGHVQVQLIVSAGMSIEPKNTRVSPGGSVLLCDGLGSGAKQLVRIFDDDPVQHVHLPTKKEVPALSDRDVNTGQHGFVDADYQGNLEGEPVDVFPDGDGWKETVGKVFSAQKYQLGFGKGLKELPVVEAALDYVLQTVPQDYVFVPVELSKL